MKATTQIPILLPTDHPQMRGFGDAKFIFDIRQKFLMSLTNQQREINQAILKQDWHITKELIHHLLGGCVYCGAPRLQKILEEAVAVIRQNKNPLPQTFIDQLNDVIEATLQALRQENIGYIK